MTPPTSIFGRGAFSTASAFSLAASSLALAFAARDSRDAFSRPAALFACTATCAQTAQTPLLTHVISRSATRHMVSLAQPQNIWCRSLSHERNGVTQCQKTYGADHSTTRHMMSLAQPQSIWWHSLSHKTSNAMYTHRHKLDKNHL